MSDGDEVIRFRKHVTGRSFEELVDLAEGNGFKEKWTKPGTRWTNESYYVSRVRRGQKLYDFDIMVCYDAEGPGAVIVIPDRGGTTDGGSLLRGE